MFKDLRKYSYHVYNRLNQNGFWDTVSEVTIDKVLLDTKKEGSE